MTHMPESLSRTCSFVESAVSDRIKVCQNERAIKPVPMARSEALNVKSGRRGRIPQPVVSCSPQNLLTRQQENRGRSQALKAWLQLRIRGVIIRITPRILGLPLFLQLTSSRDLWPLQVLDRMRDPAPEAASANTQSAVMRECGKTYNYFIS